MTNCNLFQQKEFRKFGNAKEIDNRFFVSKEKKFIFCEVPKTGISTIKKTLAELIENKNIDYNVHDRNKFILKSPCKNQLTQEEFNQMYKFTFVRNPYTRVLSAYLDKIKKNTIEKKQIYDFVNFPLEKEMSFLDFLRVLEMMPPVNINPHFRPQYLNLCYPLVKYNFVGRFEYFERDFRFILEKFFSKNVKLSIVNHHKTEASKKIEQFYNVNTIRLVQKIYAQDFLYFDYNLIF